MDPFDVMGLWFRMKINAALEMNDFTHADSMERLMHDFELFRCRFYAIPEEDQIHIVDKFWKSFKR